MVRYAAVTMSDLEALLRVTSPTYRGDGPPDIAFGTYDGAVGTLVLAASNRGVVACSYEDEHVVFERISRVVGGTIGADARRLDPVRRELDAYFSGRLRTFTLSADLQLATPFARTVLKMMVAVPYATTTTHTALAERIGRPQALHAVSNALQTNPVCVVVPCHRIADDGGYAGGAAAKRHLLTVESRAAAR
ncbi:MAG: methylated-DNA--[protein]-cysteine S-methyltransferase [Thermoactinospora sp.]|nr:methylated-DNA--[protein]-cysteine S-methyltransferase [Thermoactinospora sp.]